MAQKAEVNYRAGLPEERCGLCQHFVAEDGKCLLVDGGIAEDAVCDLFTFHEGAQPMQGSHEALEQEVLGGPYG